MELRRLLEKIESSEILGDITTSSGFNAWHLIRYDTLFHLQILSQELENPFASRRETKLERIRFALFKFRTALKNPYIFFRLRRVKYVFFASDVVNFKTAGGQFKNRVHDYFAERCKPGEALLIETISTRRSTMPRSFPAVGYETLFDLVARVGAKFVRLQDQDVTAIRRIVQYVKQEVPEDALLAEKIQHRLAQRIKRETVMFYLYDRWLKRTNLSLIFLEDACYNAKPGLQLAARRRGIPVAEPQHGLVYANHLAYNFGPAYFKSLKLRHALPDYFLAYGSYFQRNVAMPVENRPIGNPHLERFAIAQTPAPPSRRLLVTSSGCSTASVDRFLTSLQSWSRQNEYKIRFRPHPSERAGVRERYPAAFSGEIELDEADNLYDSIREVDFVIGEYSTVLFECLAFRKPAFAIRNNYYETVANSSDIIPVVTENEILSLTALLEAYPMNIADEIWETHWKERFDAFLNDVDRNRSREQ
ncbi:hypothetical protein ACWKWU_17675 [Chitinophaga lutea]